MILIAARTLLRAALLLLGLAVVAIAAPDQQPLLRSAALLSNSGTSITSGAASSSDGSASSEPAGTALQHEDRPAAFKTESDAQDTATTSIIRLLDVHSYTFDQFLVDFGRTYDDPVEYQVRRAIFQENLRTIVRHNQQQQQKNMISSTTTKKTKSDGYWMGINAFADRRADELLTGYDKHQSTRRLRRQQEPLASRNDPQEHSWTLAGSTLDSSRTSTSTTTGRRQLLKHSDDAIEMRITLNDPVDQLPATVDWRTQGVTTPVKNQGMCGSCWAFASTAVLESHVALQTGVLYELSPQELVSCAANQNHCGGTGGCTGATAELAFDLVRDAGIVQEWSFGYQDAHGDDINCTLAEHTMHKGEDDPKLYFQGAVASIVDYAVLPSNNYTALMNVVAKLGPVAVSVACSPWHLYQSGVFYSPLSAGGKATDLNHLVVLEGYGTDEETGEDYWIVRNSWGPRWGENGYIRLKRVGESECGVDETPSDGTACTLDPDGNPIEPEPQTICGNSGILFDSTIPLGGYLL